MKDPSAAVSEAIFAKLLANTAVKARLGDPVRVYDKVPDAPTYPYARVGDDQVVGDSNGCADAWEVYATLHIFSRKPEYPRLDVKDISNDIALAIGDNDSLILPAGFVVSEVSLEQARSYMEEDGLTAHGVLTLKYLIDDGA